MSQLGVEIYRMPITYDQIVFEDTQSYCLNPLRNGKPCPAYGNNWACPPVAPHFTIIKKKLARYEEFLVIIFELDLRVRKEQFREKHPEWDEQKLQLNACNSHLYNGKIYWGLRKILKPFQRNPYLYVLGNADCRRCGKGCAKKLGQPCRHPKERIYSMEACGINVDASLRNIGYELQWNSKKRVCQVGLVCSRKGNPFQLLKKGNGIWS